MNGYDTITNCYSTLRYTALYTVLLIPTDFTQQYYRLDVQLSKLHVSTFMAIIRLTKDWYQGIKKVAAPMGSHGLQCLCIYFAVPMGSHGLQCLCIYFAVPIGSHGLHCILKTMQTMGSHRYSEVDAETMQEIP